MNWQVSYHQMVITFYQGMIVLFLLNFFNLNLIDNQRLDIKVALVLSWPFLLKSLMIILAFAIMSQWNFKPVSLLGQMLMLSAGVKHRVLLIRGLIYFHFFSLWSVANNLLPDNWFEVSLLRKKTTIKLFGRLGVMLSCIITIKVYVSIRRAMELGGWPLIVVRGDIVQVKLMFGLGEAFSIWT